MIILEIKIEEMKEQENKYITFVNVYARSKRKKATFYEMKKEAQIRNYIQKNQITCTDNEDYVVDFEELKKQIKNKRGNNNGRK